MSRPYETLETLCWVVIGIGLVGSLTILAWVSFEWGAPGSAPPGTPRSGVSGLVFSVPFLITGFVAALAAIPARIAAGKGHGPFWGWWLYGFLLWPFALVHALLFLQPRSTHSPSV